MNQELTETTECMKCGRECSVYLPPIQRDRNETRAWLSSCCGFPVRVYSIPRVKNQETGG